ncbi:MAG: amidohydrolase family protein [Candidatus Sulfopaludibacter sp.]|nr:amidohydrolase family protein [Candidatus Sulfopaludibacter sp.]
MQTPWGNCDVADAHVHFFSRRFLEALGSQCGKDQREVATAVGWDFPGNAEELALRWRDELDQYGVGRAALIASVPGDEPSVIAAQAAAPGRFFAYAMINPLAQATVNPSLNAICLFPSMHGYSLHDECVDGLLQQASAQRQAVFVHRGVLTVGVRKKLGLPSPFDMRHSNPLELHAAAQRYPQVPFVVPHFGAGFLREALMLADLCPNVYLDTSSSNSWMRYEGLDLKTVFHRAMDVAGAGRLLFGTDSSFFPRGWNHEVYEAQTRTLSDMGISAADARLILGENLQRILAA